MSYFRHSTMRTLHLTIMALTLMAVTNLFALRSGATKRAMTTELTQPAPAARAQMSKSYGQLPLQFEANHGQADAQVKFLSRGSGYSLALTSTEAVLRLRDADWGLRVKDRGSRTEDGRLLQSPASSTLNARSSVLRMRLVGANPKARITGLEELPGKTNYLIGNDPNKWRTDVPTYAKVRYQEVYPGIDLIYYGNQGQLEYDFRLAPGADPGVIALQFEGADKIEVDEAGDLVLQMAGRQVRQHKPVIYQEVNGVRQRITGRYQLLDADASIRSRRVGFQVADYDRSQPLVIDPVLSYATFWGIKTTFGPNYLNVYGNSIAVDAAGNAYVAGFYLHEDSSRYGFDAFVVKLNPTGTAVIYTALFGGSDDEAIYGIAVDSAGQASVTGLTESLNFPTANARQRQLAGGFGDVDAFVAKLNAAGNDFIYSTYLGGSDDEGAGLSDGQGAIAVDRDSNVYVTGTTTSRDFPVAGTPFQPRLIDTDAFVTKLNPQGQLIYSTFLGGNGADDGQGIAVDATGNAYITGRTTSDNFPLKEALQKSRGTVGGDGFITKLNPTGSELIYSTFLGGRDGDDQGMGIAVDELGHAYVAGTTDATDFPVKNGLPITRRGLDAFAVKLNAAGSDLVYATYLGGSKHEQGFGIGVDALGNAYVSGRTASPDFPVKDAVQPRPAASNCTGDAFSCPDAFIVKLDPAGSLSYSTYLGGTNDESFVSYVDGFKIIGGIAVDQAGNAYVTGNASSDFPVTPGAFKTTSLGSDIFIAKIGEGGSSPAVATSVSAANYKGPELAVESIVAAFGSNLATRPEAAASLPLPTTLAGTSVKLRDSAGTERLAPLFIVTPGQINYQLPEGAATGTATVTVTSGDGKVSTGTVQIVPVAPGLFSADASGQGLAAAVALRVKSNGAQSYEPVVQFDPGQNRLIAVPIDLGPDSDQVFLILFGTGIRYRSSLLAAAVKIGGLDAQVLYAGPSSFVGLDQINVRLPRSLTGRGEVEIALVVDGKTANPVKVNIR